MEGKVLRVQNTWGEWSQNNTLCFLSEPEIFLPANAVIVISNVLLQLSVEDLGTCGSVWHTRFHSSCVSKNKSMHDLTMTAAVFTPLTHFDLPQQNVIPNNRRG